VKLKTRIFDSWSILEWINKRQPACLIVDNLLAESQAGKAALFMSAINVGEVYYFIRRVRGLELAERWRNSSHTLPVTIEVPTNNEIWKAAELKAQFPISYADAFAGASALKHHSPLVTGHPEFKSVTGLQLDWIDRR